MFDFVRFGHGLHYYVMYIRVLSGHLRGMCAGTLGQGGYASAPCSKGTGQHTHGADAREDGGVDGNAVDDRTRRKDRKNERDS